MKLLVSFALCWAITAGMAGAEAALPSDLPGKMLKRMKEAPDAFVEDAAELILGFGQAGAIDGAAIAQALALDRASARGRAMSQLMQADLDGDGVAAADEITVLLRAISAKGRGKLALVLQEADENGDGAITVDERANAVAKAGLDAVSPAREAALMGLMHLDMDDNGTLTLIEVKQAVGLARDKV